MPLLTHPQVTLTTHIGKDETANQTKQNEHIPSLDGLRAISIGLVIAGHATNGTSHSFFFNAALLHADLGVRMFFIISGFLITTLLAREYACFGSVSLTLFYVRRTLRILPALGLYVSIVAVLSALDIVPVPRWFWLYVLTYTVNFAPFAVWALGHLWSLSVEEQFYLLWPLVMKAAPRKTWKAVIILAIVIGPTSHLLNHALSGHLPAYSFPFVCGPLALGCFLGLNLQTAKNFITSSKILSNGSVLTLTAISIALLDIATDRSAAKVILGLVNNILLTFVVARVVLVKTGIAFRVLNSVGLMLVGRLSYSLYLWQQLFLNPTATPPIKLPFPVNIALIFCAASTSYWCIERKFLGLRHRFRRDP